LAFVAREIWSAVAEGEARRHRFSRQTLLLLITQPYSTSAFVGQPDLGVDRQNGEKRCRRFALPPHSKWRTRSLPKLNGYQNRGAKVLGDHQTTRQRRTVSRLLRLNRIQPKQCEAVLKEAASGVA